MIHTLIVHVKPHIVWSNLLLLTILSLQTFYWNPAA